MCLFGEWLKTIACLLVCFCLSWLTNFSEKHQRHWKNFETTSICLVLTPEVWLDSAFLWNDIIHDDYVFVQFMVIHFTRNDIFKETKSIVLVAGLARATESKCVQICCDWLATESINRMRSVINHGKDCVRFSTDSQICPSRFSFFCISSLLLMLTIKRPRWFSLL